MAAQDPHADDEWDAALLSELAGVLPSLRDGAGVPDAALADERYRAHRAIRSLLERLAQPAPLVVVLDDLHWSDGASIELIGALLRRGPDAPVLLALAFRPGQAPERLSATLAAPGVGRLALGHLSETAAAELLGGIDAGALADIQRHGGGNPFYLEQLARAREQGRLPATAIEVPGNGALGDGGVPAAVTASLAEELESLSAPTRLLLDGAAVAGEPFEPDLAAAIAGLSAADGLDGLDELLTRDLVRPTQVPRRFVFRHPLVRRAVYESTGGGWRLAAHARAATALADNGAAAAERAHHVEHSAGQGDEDAIALLVEAGAATAARAPAAATRWFEAALRLLPAADRERQADLRVALASAQRSLGELDHCRATLLEAIALLPEDAVARRVELTAYCAAVEHWQGEHEDAHRRLARAWTELPDPHTPEAAALQIELAIDGLYELDFDQTLEMGRAALATARELGDRPLHAAAAAALALGEASAGQIAPAREHREEALAEIDRLTDAELAPRLEALYYLGWAENYLEHYDAAIAHVDRGIAIARATGEGRLLLPMMLVQGYPFEIQGQMAAAIELCDAAVEAARVSANPHYLFWALFELAWARYYSGDLERHDRGLRGERAGRRPDDRRDDAVGGWRSGLGARLRLVRARRARNGAGDHAHRLWRRARRRRSPSSAASTGRCSRSPSWRPGGPRRPDEYARRAERERRRARGCACRPRSPAARAPRVLLATGDAAGRGGRGGAIGRRRARDRRPRCRRRTPAS